MTDVITTCCFRPRPDMKMRQEVDAFMAGVPPEKYVQDHYELERALTRWGSS